MKKPIARIASAVQASATLKIDAMFKKMQADGLDVVGFGAGEPDFPTPENIKQAGIRAIEANQSKYTPAAGLESLRKAVCAQIARDYGVEYAPSQVLISSGAKHNIFVALMALCDPGDEVILPAPYWVSYYEIIRMAGALPVIVDCGKDTGYKMTAEMFEKAITDKTKMLILCSPSNPTGCVYSKQELADIAGVCVRHGIYVLADEIYYKLIYDGAEHVSMASLGSDIKDLTITCNGVSKSYAMTGWRIGYIAANDEIAKTVANYQSHAASAPNSIAQIAALEALTGPQEGIEDMRKAFAERRSYIISRLNEMGMNYIKPEGAFYIMINVSDFLNRPFYGKTLGSSEDFAQMFLEKALVAVVPCSGFGAPDYIRFSYATALDNIREGMDRLGKFVKEQY